MSSRSRSTTIRSKRDNRRWLVVPVRESLNVLAGRRSFQVRALPDRDRLSGRALSPSEESPGQPRPIKVEVVSESQLSRRELAPIDVVVLCNVAQFSPSRGDGPRRFSQARRGRRGLRRRSGRSPKITTAACTTTARACCRLDRRQRGRRQPKRRRVLFQPARLTGIRSWPRIRARPGPVTSGLDSGAYLAISQAADSQGLEGRGCACGLTRGDPAVVEARRHRGTVILVATSADTGWTTWPIHKSYAPVMQEIVLRAAAGRLSDRNIRVGQPFDQSFPAPGAAAPVTVVPPRGQSVATKLHRLRAASASSISSRPNWRASTRSRSGRRLRSNRRSRPTPTLPKAISTKLDQLGLDRDFAGLEFPVSDQLRKN